MFTFITQLLETTTTGQVYLFTIFFMYVWLRWIILNGLALFYRVYTEPYYRRVSVIIPVVDEDPEIFRDVLERIQTEVQQWIKRKKRMTGGSEIIVVINGPRNLTLEAVCKEFALVRTIYTARRGKRNALKLGVLAARGEIAVLVDSDTRWTGKTLRELMKPFSNPKVGGVTTHQLIFDPNRTRVTRFANWMEDIRSHGSFPALSFLGQVGCLPGRTIAFRMSILKESIDKFVDEYFIDINVDWAIRIPFTQVRIPIKFHLQLLKMEISDDRSLTNFTLKAGFQRVYQRSSMVYTDAPLVWRVFRRQQLRWARGSQLNTLKMLGWMLFHTPVLFFVFVTDIVTPYFLVALAMLAVYKIYFNIGGLMILRGTVFDSNVILLTAAFIGALLSIGVRQIGHFRRKPDDIKYLPDFVITLTFLMTPIRIWGFITMFQAASWGTRSGAIRRAEIEEDESSEE